MKFVPKAIPTGLLINPDLHYSFLEVNIYLFVKMKDSFEVNKMSTKCLSCTDSMRT